MPIYAPELIRAEQIRLLYRKAPLGLAANLFNGGLLTAVLWPVTPHGRLLNWLAALIAVTLGRIGLIRLYARAKPAGAASRCWGMAFTCGAALAGAVWGGAVLWLFPESDPMRQTFLAFVLAGMAAGSVPVLSSVFPAVTAYLLLVLLPLVGRFAIAGDDLGTAMAAMTLLFTALMLHTARHHHREIRHTIQLRFDNRQLLERLEADKAATERLNAELRSEIDERRQAQAALGRSEERFQLAMQGANDGLWDWDMASGRVYYSPRWKQLLGFADHEIGEGLEEWLQRVHPEDRERTEAELRDYVSGLTPVFENLHRLQHEDGHYVWTLARASALYDDSARAYRLVGTHADISDLKQVQEELFREKERMQITLAAIAEAVATTDAEGRLEYLNPAAERLLGRRAETLLFQPLDQVLPTLDPHSREPVASALAQCLASGVTLEQEALLAGDGGPERWLDAFATPLRNQSGRVIGAVTVIRDVTEDRKLSRQLAHQASHDALTGLANRREFERRVQDAFECSRREGTAHVLCYLDLDSFKPVNDSAGHDAGDELLRQLSQFFRAKVRQSDTVARLGGDEFAVLLENCHLEQGRLFAETLCQGVREFRFSWQDKPFSIGVSIGLAALSPTSTSIEQALAAADAACLAAKEAGRNRVQVGSPQETMTRPQRAWSERLEQALAEDRFCLYAQPLQPLQSAAQGKGFEVLLRLREHGQLMLPGAFLPAAERAGWLPALDRWVLEAVLNRLEAHTEPLDGLALCAVNLSAASLCDPDFLDFARHRLRASTLPLYKLCFEVSETALLANLAKAGPGITDLKKLGCRFALDDFGSGACALNYLKALPVDMLKLDGSLIKDLDADPLSQSLVRSACEIGHLLGKSIVAEQVEQHEWLARLAELGVDYAQGYGVAKPHPLELWLTAPRQASELIHA